ncbi:MAG: hypothetical protein HY855_10250 [Burkholderiales bacterium]|nr:hypothetical protein [Burkholderiales bacterium]
MDLSIFRRAVFPQPTTAAPRRPARRWLLGTCIGLLPALALAQPVPKPPRTSPTTHLTDSWKINGNGWPGDLVIYQDFLGGRLHGTMYGNPIVGYFAHVEGTAVIVRYSHLNIPMQAFVGTVSPDGTRWSGKFYGLDTGQSGATEAQNVWSFTATRGTASMPPAPPAPSLGAAAPLPLEDGYALTANGYPGTLGFVSGSISYPNFGQLDGTVYTQALMGSFAQGANSLAFLRLHNGLPAQLFIGGTVGGTTRSCALAGTFYPLTEGMGADPTRLTYGWTAQVPQGLCN